ncbi:ras and ef-hand domain-containing protein [Anaeramoeba flamelloides]|uniref:Ras and ef-hand domain-containing protein n=1 Tax=Anaeramoeba flamelloides TaxID=1746091 RepID=A0AAV7Y3S8_9EUKA|nr:ras and ef-hand domain-containing protein [Anaeramoeba flamelloides]
MSNEFSIKFKVVLLGQSAVGKTSFCIRFCQNEFELNQEPTIGAAFQNCLLDLGEKKVTLQIWYYRGAKGAIIIYDVTNPGSYESAKDWVKEIRQQGSSSVKVILVANKIDLTNHSVQKTEVLKYCEKHNLLFSEVSAKNGLGVDELFYDLATDMTNQYKMDVLGENSVNYVEENKKETRNIILEENTKNQKKESGCC